MNQKKYNAKIINLIRAFADVQKCMGTDTDIQPEEYAENMSQLFDILAHDWTTGLKELYRIWGYFTLKTNSVSPDEQETVWDNISGHFLSIATLAGYKEFIEQQQPFFEQLATHLQYETLHKKIYIFSDIRDLKKLFDLLAYLNDKLKLPEHLFFRIRQSVTEAVNNAILHGNKKSFDKMICIKAVKQEESLTISVRDEGCGFNYQNLTYTLPGNEKESGRGLFLIKQATDELSFEDGGSKIIMKFNLTPLNL